MPLSLLVVPLSLPVFSLYLPFSAPVLAFFLSGPAPVLAPILAFSARVFALSAPVLAFSALVLAFSPPYVLFFLEVFVIRDYKSIRLELYLLISTRRRVDLRTLMLFILINRSIDRSYTDGSSSLRSSQSRD